MAAACFAAAQQRPTEPECQEALGKGDEVMEEWLELNRALMERNIEVWEKIGRLEARLQWLEERSCYGGNQRVGNEPCKVVHLHPKR